MSDPLAYILEYASYDAEKIEEIRKQIATYLDLPDIYSTDDFGDDNVERFNKGMEAVQALQQGKIDAVIIDNQPAKTFVEENEGLKILETSYVEEDYALAIKKGNDDLVKKVNDAIKELKEDGTFDKIVAKYITD